MWRLVEQVSVSWGLSLNAGASKPASHRLTLLRVLHDEPVNRIGREVLSEDMVCAESSSSKVSEVHSSRKALWGIALLH